MIATAPTLSFSASFRLRSPSIHDIHQSAVSSPQSISSPRPRTHVSAAYASSSTMSARERQYSSSSSSSLYDLLEVDVGATGQEIKAAYRKKVKVCHPDAVPLYQKDTSADHFMEVHAAYSALSDPVKRADYDRSLLVIPNRLRPGFYYNSEGSGSPSPSPATGFTRKTWETDQCW